MTHQIKITNTWSHLRRTNNTIRSSDFQAPSHCIINPNPQFERQQASSSVTFTTKLYGGVKAVKKWRIVWRRATDNCPSRTRIKISTTRERERENYSVPFWRRMRNCSGERIALHSSSVFSILAGAAAMAVLRLMQADETEPLLTGTCVDGGRKRLTDWLIQGRGFHQRQGWWRFSEGRWRWMGFFFF